MKPAAAILAAFAVFATTAANADTYTESDLVLAGQLGAAVALAGLCDPNNLPFDGVRKALVEHGLSEADVTSNGEFKARMDRQVFAINASKEMLRKQGTSDAEIIARSCDQLARFYGPDGEVLPGIVD